jgi:hypothetical protein
MESYLRCVVASARHARRAARVRIIERHSGRDPEPAADDIAGDKARQSLAYSWRIAVEALPHAELQRPAL